MKKQIPGISILLTLFVLLSIAGKSSAQMYADVETSEGSFTCELNFKQTPRTVASFVSLAEGTRQWVDERNGVISTIKPAQPFYSGITFHRVINQQGFKIIQAGSKRGDGTDGPGYEFPDEMNVNLPDTYRFDQPYYLAMANSGPNTNGSQFFITGEAIPGLEGKHTVFGKVVSGQSVIDAILGASVDANDRPDNDITIERITIRRSSKEAQKFKPSSFKLPTLSVPSFTTTVAPGPANTNRYSLKQGLRSELLVYATIDPAQNTWQKLNSRWYAAPASIPNYYDISYPAGNPITGFRPIIVKYNTDAVTPGTLWGWRLSLENNEGVYLFSFPTVGAMSYTFTPVGSAIPQTGTIIPKSLGFQLSPYHAIVQFELDQQKIIYLQLGFDKKLKNNLYGRCVSRIKNFVVTDAETGNGDYPNDFTEPGGDKGFSMVPIR
jgi:cyclophilin family peptidyl-prolyl cis-trans isomerase